MGDLTHAMAIILAQSSADLSDDRETMQVLADAGYSNTAIIACLYAAVDHARSIRHVDAICAGLPGEAAYG